MIDVKRALPPKVAIQRPSRLSERKLWSITSTINIDTKARPRSTEPGWVILLEYRGIYQVRHIREFLYHHARGTQSRGEFLTRGTAQSIA